MNAQSFELAYESGLKCTVNFLHSRGVPRDRASDFAQAAWLRAWEKLNQLRDESRIVSWVNTIAINECRRALRKAKQEVALSAGCEGRTTLNVAAIDVERILEACSIEDRNLLKAQMEGASAGELGRKSGVSATAIRLRLWRARRQARHLCDGNPVCAA
jgi:RNA polymerase sigma factor (sigma-70 family)